ncbi:DUF2589 domain-containing protein [Kistimonas asteriae]|uniref:DUF2589 domain-containing protein n=1 Tax=Kistimonas asteriae TaxID=517724 RepID=UPI001BACC67D|nr:DUF2589 domain-containing protein [Kistimonas asteriae]
MSNNTLDDLVDGITNAMIGAREIMERQHIKTISRYFDRDNKNRFVAKTTKVMIPNTDVNDATLQEVDLPLFSIVPLNSLRLDSVEIEFEASLSDVGSEKEAGGKKLKMDVMGGGLLGNKKKNCKVKVTIVKDDPPEGLVRVNNHVVKTIP